MIQTISNEVVNWENLKPTIENGGVTFASPQVLQLGRSTIVSEENGMKFITGGNLGINLVRLNKISPFYNPPNARGEDTFLSTCLANIKVVRIPSYTFHDGFLVYSDILKGTFPKVLAPITSLKKNNLNRFIAALNGWIRYKPLLILITQGQLAYPSKMKIIKKNLSEVLPKFSKSYNNSKFLDITESFNEYSANVNVHYLEYTDAKKVWKQLLKEPVLLLQTKNN